MEIAKNVVIFLLITFFIGSINLIASTKGVPGVMLRILFVFSMFSVFKFI